MIAYNVPDLMSGLWESEGVVSGPLVTGTVGLVAVMLTEETMGNGVACRRALTALDHKRAMVSPLFSTHADMITSNSSCSRDILLLQLRRQPSEKILCIFFLSFVCVVCLVGD